MKYMLITALLTLAFAPAPFPKTPRPQTVWWEKESWVKMECGCYTCNKRIPCRVKKITSNRHSDWYGPPGKCPVCGGSDTYHLPDEE